MDARLVIKTAAEHCMSPAKMTILEWHCQRKENINAMCCSNSVAQMKRASMRLIAISDWLILKGSSRSYLRESKLSRLQFNSDNNSLCWRELSVCQPPSKLNPHAMKRQMRQMGRIDCVPYQKTFPSWKRGIKVTTIPTQWGVATGFCNSGPVAPLKN